MDTSKSAFYHFGLLPQICIHSIIEDQYSEMYVAETICKCGCSDWIESTMKAFIIDGITISKDVHRCKKCNSVRTASHIGSEINN